MTMNMTPEDKRRNVLKAANPKLYYAAEEGLDVWVDVTEKVPGQGWTPWQRLRKCTLSLRDYGDTTKIVYDPEPHWKIKKRQQLPLGELRVVTLNFLMIPIWVKEWEIPRNIHICHGDTIQPAGIGTLVEWSARP